MERSAPAKRTNRNTSLEARLSELRTTERIRGLDTLRALAIVAVMFFHLGGYMPSAWYPATRYGGSGSTFSLCLAAI